MFREKLNGTEIEKNQMFDILMNNEKAADNELPDTGIGLEKERLLSSIFIESPEYGTRLSTILTIDYEGKVEFHERSFVPEDENFFEFNIEK